MKILIPVFFIFLLFCVACSDYSPKPRGYFRIEPGTHEYVDFEGSDYSFQRSSQSVIQEVKDTIDGDGFNIIYPLLNVTIYCSYLPINQSDFQNAAEDSRKFVYRHVVKADGIGDYLYSDLEKGVYGIVYEIQGDVASPLQFVLTDSVKHFFRGALYFNNRPNQDSVAPVLEYVRNDVSELISSFHWKN